MDVWTKFIPRAIFTAEDGSPIHAILDVQDENDMKNLSEMFENRGGSVMRDLHCPFTIILTDKPQQHSRYPKYPIFHVKWIIDCIVSVELMDINNYLIDKEKFANRNFMDVIYHKLETSKGTLLVENLDETPRVDWKMDKTKSRGKQKRRRGPPKNEDCVKLQVDRISREDDFYTELTTSVVRKAIENILLNERSLISKTKDELKKYDPDFDKRICNNSLSSVKCSGNARVGDESQPHPVCSTSQEEQTRCGTQNRTSHKLSEDSTRSSTVAESSGLMGAGTSKQIRSFTNQEGLHCGANMLPLSSRVQMVPQKLSHPPDPSDKL